MSGDRVRRFREASTPMIQVTGTATRLAPFGVNRNQAQLICAGLFGLGAALIVVGKTHLIPLDDLAGHPGARFDYGQLADDAATRFGLLLAICGALYLVYLWSAERFRVSIGRIMLIVAILAVVIQGVLLWQRAEIARMRTPTTGPTVAPKSG